MNDKIYAYQLEYLYPDMYSLYRQFLRIIMSFSFSPRHGTLNIHLIQFNE